MDIAAEIIINTFRYKLWACDISFYAGVTGVLYTILGSPVRAVSDNVSIDYLAMVMSAQVPSGSIPAQFSSPAAYRDPLVFETFGG
jgi:hypothetical protein